MNIVIKNIATYGWYALRVNTNSGPSFAQIFFTPSLFTGTLGDVGIKKILIAGDNKIALVGGAKQGNDIRIKITFSESTAGSIEFLRVNNNGFTIDYPTT